MHDPARRRILFQRDLTSAKKLALPAAEKSRYDFPQNLLAGPAAEKLLVQLACERPSTNKY